MPPVKSSEQLSRAQVKNNQYQLNQHKKMVQLMQSEAGQRRVYPPVPEEYTAYIECTNENYNIVDQPHYNETANEGKYREVDNRHRMRIIIDHCLARAKGKDNSFQVGNGNTIAITNTRSTKDGPFIHFTNRDINGAWEPDPKSEAYRTCIQTPLIVNRPETEEPEILNIARTAYCNTKHQTKVSTTSPHFSNSRTTQGVPRYSAAVQIAPTPVNESGYEIVGYADKNGGKIAGLAGLATFLTIGMIMITVGVKRSCDKKHKYSVARAQAAAAQNVELRPLNQGGAEV
ncbi:MAG: hypothetical protein C5B47_00525 [Verrucomicrobia bacterium]|nr:MAG: hypothetical protein C5B47_00525 [Verrucomicrobiota bacterium]